MIKKLIYILIMFIFCSNIVSAEPQEASLQYNKYKYTFKKGDNLIFAQKAEANFKLSETAQTPEDKVVYLQEAMRYYYLLSQIEPRSLEAQIGLARVYDELHLDRYAKKHFYKAIDFSKKAPKAYFYFANFYYKRNDFLNAQKYYQKAYDNGYSNDFQTNNMLGIINEKVGDIEVAKKFYIKAYSLDKNHVELAPKIQALDGLNYSQSQYYLFQK